MSPISWLNNLLLIENVLGIYRNYCEHTKFMKRFIISQTFSQIILHFIDVVGEVKNLLKGDKYEYNQINYIYAGFYTFSCVNSVSFVVTGIYYSRAFMSYYRSISRVSESFNDDSKLIKSLKKLNWFSIILILNYIAFVIYKSVELLKLFSHANILFLSIILLSHVITRVHMELQYLILFAVIMLVVHLFKSLTSLVSAAQERVGISNITREQIHEWVDLYRDLANCCEKVTVCFGRQFFFTLTISTSYHVLIMYEISYNVVVIGTGDSTEFRNTGLIICVYILLMLMPIVAGQLARNQGMKFHRVLARLYNTRIFDFPEAEVKLIKDFIRLIKKNPIEIKLFPKVPAGMYMLPILLSLVVNYIIVVLQFNHII